MKHQVQRQHLICMFTQHSSEHCQFQSLYQSLPKKTRNLSLSWLIIILLFVPMHYLTRSFLPRVYRIKIQGNITPAMTQSITRGLQCWPYYPQALLVTINSGGGSITQARNISDLLKLYSNRLNIPIITFAEDACLGSANIILTSGVKCYSSQFSMIGDLGHVWSQLWFDKLANKYQVKQDSIHASSNQIKVNPIQQLTKESEAWVKNYAYTIDHELKSAIMANRGANLQRKGLAKAEIDAKILSVGVTNPQNLVKYGFLDGFKTYDQEIKQRFSHSKVREITHKQRYAFS